MQSVESISDLVAISDNVVELSVQPERDFILKEEPSDVGDITYTVGTRVEVLRSFKGDLPAGSTITLLNVISGTSFEDAIAANQHGIGVIPTLARTASDRYIMGLVRFGDASDQYAPANGPSTIIQFARHGDQFVVSPQCPSEVVGKPCTGFPWSYRDVGLDSVINEVRAATGET
jgi:hypothetical protein